MPRYAFEGRPAGSGGQRERNRISALGISRRLAKAEHSFVIIRAVETPDPDVRSSQSDDWMRANSCPMSPSGPAPTR